MWESQSHPTNMNTWIPAEAREKKLPECPPNPFLSPLPICLPAGMHSGALCSLPGTRSSLQKGILTSTPEPSPLQPWGLRDAPRIILSASWQAKGGGQGNMASFSVRPGELVWGWQQSWRSWGSEPSSLKELGFQWSSRCSPSCPGHINVGENMALNSAARGSRSGWTGEEWAKEKLGGGHTWKKVTGRINHRYSISVEQLIGLYNWRTARKGCLYRRKQTGAPALGFWRTP